MKQFVKNIVNEINKIGRVLSLVVQKDNQSDKQDRMVSSLSCDCKFCIDIRTKQLERRNMLEDCGVLDD